MVLQRPCVEVDTTTFVDVETVHCTDTGWDWTQSAHLSLAGRAPGIGGVYDFEIYINFVQKIKVWNWKIGMQIVGFLGLLGIYGGVGCKMTQLNGCSLRPIWQKRVGGTRPTRHINSKMETLTSCLFNSLFARTNIEHSRIPGIECRQQMR